MRLVTAIAMIAVLLSGCGGSGDGTPGDKTPATATKGAKTTATPANTETTASPAPLEGKPAPEDLSGFVCDRNDAGEWSSSGVLKNTTKADATYRVTVFLGEANGKSANATTKHIGVIKAGQSLSFTYESLPEADADVQCFVQVLRDQ